VTAQANGKNRYQLEYAKPSLSALSFVVPNVVPETKTAVMVPNVVPLCGAKFGKKKQVSGNTPSDLRKFWCAVRDSNPRPHDS